MKKQLTLSQFLQEVKETIDHNFYGNVYKIIAETTDIKIYWNRTYAFLKLIEKKGEDIIAECGAVIWRDYFGIIQKFNKNTGISFEQNLELLLDVELQYHPRWGLRLSILKIDENYTLGKLEQEKTKTLELLCKNEPNFIWIDGEEYITKNQCLDFPIVVKNIALLSASGSDGRRDFLHELANNEYQFGFNLCEFPVQVQGAVAASEIANTLHKINGIKKNPFDSICIVRGGGSNTDFTGFNDYNVALEIAKCKQPVITGIGHERNVSIADLMAHTTAKTPTKCAQTIIENNVFFASEIQQNIKMIHTTTKEKIFQQKNEINNIKNLIKTSVNNNIQMYHTQLLNIEKSMLLINPKYTLDLGYVIVRNSENKIITNAVTAMQYDELQLQFKDKKINVKVLK